jgi:hypothetical protein
MRWRGRSRARPLSGVRAAGYRGSRASADNLAASTASIRHTELCIKVLAGIAQNGESESARVSAAGILLDRGLGKAAQIRTPTA